MLLQGKINRAMKWSRDRRLRSEGRDPEQEALEAEVSRHGKGNWKKEEALPSMEEIIREEQENRPLDKKDMLPLIFSGMITLVPVCLGLICLICFLVYAFFFIR